MLQFYGMGYFKLPPPKKKEVQRAIQKLWVSFYRFSCVTLHIFAIHATIEQVFFL